jgi:hypothetical protein
LRFRCSLSLCVFALVLSAASARASETDQFTLPTAPLDDVGHDLAARVLEIVHAEAARLNLEIDAKIQGDPGASVPPLDEYAVLTHIYQEVGVGIPESTLERAIRYGDFGARNVRFQPAYTDSIYAWVFSPVPFALLAPAQSPTVKVYGVELGTDKIGHIFQQGYEYFNLYTGARSRGADEKSAAASAVRYGVLSEDGIYGVMLTGVYSNGDLAANYAGFKFYDNLLHSVRIGESTLPPILVRDGAHWIVAPERDNADLMKPYITEHLNEAFNPSKYLFSVERIRKYVRERCSRWVQEVPGFDEASYRAHLERTKTWYGEDYGWDLPADDAATLLVCFAPQAPLDRDPSAM